MKTLKNIIVLALATLLFSCSKSTTDFDPAGIQAAVEKGEWRVTRFWDKTKDETQHFADFAFTFADDGTVSASNCCITVTGTWSTHNSSDDGHVDFDLHFPGSTDHFEDISDDWHVVEQSKSLIKLEDVSGGSGEIEYLDFEKI